MDIIFCIDKKHEIEHFKVNHPDISENDIHEVFENIYFEFENKKHTKTLIGHTNSKKFIVVAGIFNRTKDKFKLITAYRAKRKHIIFWKQEVTKND